MKYRIKTDSETGEQYAHLEVSLAELWRIRDALDSHAYWQLSRPENRYDGNVFLPGDTGFIEPEDEDEADQDYECEAACELHDEFEKACLSATTDYDEHCKR